MARSVEFANLDRAEQGKALLQQIEAGRYPTGMTVQHAIRNICHFLRIHGYDVEAVVEGGLGRYRQDLREEEREQ